MVMWIGFGAVMFISVYNALGGVTFIKTLMLSLPVEPWVLLVGMMLIVILLGMIIEWVGIIMLVVPIFIPIAAALGFDPLWFGMLICINLQMDVLTPPFGYALFYMKGVAPREITTMDIFRASIPFVFIQLTVLVLAMIFPQIVMWLPSQV
jgi:TRAP-type mannitol/chloroaromatic compound transport system permease large subunit